jgi:hypothetical protein
MDREKIIEVLIIIDAILFFAFFLAVFINVWSRACSHYLFTFERKIYFSIKKKHIVVLLILFINLLITKIIQKIMGEVNW